MGTEVIKQLLFKNSITHHQQSIAESAVNQQQQEMFVFTLFWAVMADKIFPFSELICSESPSIFVFLSKSLWLIIVGESYSVCFILMNKTQSAGRFVFKQGWNKIQWEIFAFLVSFVWCSGFKSVAPRSKSRYGKSRVRPQWWIKSCYPEYLKLLFCSEARGW